MRLISLFITLFSMTTACIHACTGIKLTAKDHSIVHGRTLEFGIQIDTSITVIPQGYLFTGTTSQGPGLQYKAKYAAIGASTFDSPALMDGINEKGLAAAAFYFPGYAKYSNLNGDNQSRALSPLDFVNWVLTQFSTIEEVKAGLQNILIVPLISKDWGPTPPPFHYIVYDKTGKSLVIEPINGELMTYDNPLGVYTNSPTFDWHLTNLRNYINLTPFNAKPLNVEGIELAPFGQGSGMVGLPGDFTPPSRFIRAAIFTITALPVNNVKESVYQAFHILNQFDIPVGVARSKSNGITYTDSTMITCVRDPQNLKFYFKTYEDQTIRVVDLKKFNLKASQLKQLKTSEFSQPVVDVSERL